jgi:hypothetical protein
MPCRPATLPNAASYIQRLPNAEQRIPLQLPLAPVLLLAIRIRALDAVMHRPQHPGPENRTGLNRSTGIGTGTIAAIIAAVVIAGALMLFGPWGNNNRTAINNSGPASNSAPGTTTGQTSTSSRGVTPTTVTPAAPGTTAPANAR